LKALTGIALAAGDILVKLEQLPLFKRNVIVAALFLIIQRVMVLGALFFG
jgi:hypothetical protein